MRALFFVTALALVACTPNPPLAPPPSDAAPDATVDGTAPPAGDVAQRACDNLRALGCWEGLQANCADRIRAIAATKIIRTPSGGVWDGSCVANARDVAAAEACGSIRCAPP